MRKLITHGLDATCGVWDRRPTWLHWLPPHRCILAGWAARLDLRWHTGLYGEPFVFEDKELDD